MTFPFWLNHEPLLLIIDPFSFTALIFGMDGSLFVALCRGYSETVLRISLSNRSPDQKLIFPFPLLRSAQPSHNSTSCLTRESHVDVLSRLLLAINSLVFTRVFFGMHRLFSSSLIAVFRAPSKGEWTIANPAANGCPFCVCGPLPLSHRTEKPSSSPPSTCKPGPLQPDSMPMQTCRCFIFVLFSFQRISLLLLSLSVCC